MKIVITTEALKSPIEIEWTVGQLHNTRIRCEGVKTMQLHTDSPEEAVRIATQEILR